MVPENHLDFLNAVWTRRPIFTYIFFGANILIFLLMALAGGSMNEPTLNAFGVKSNAAIARGEWWRFVTPIFLHIGMLHLFFNSYALWIVGPQVERLYGGARFVILYVLTGIAGVLGSYVYHPQGISAGASGAIFGLFGVLLVFGIRYRDSVPPAFKRAVGTGVLPIIVINLIIGFTIPVVDNAAHISGLLAGGLLAAIVPFQSPGDDTHRFYETLQVALLGVIAVSFYQVGVHYDGPNFSVRNFGRSVSQILSAGSTTKDFIDGVNAAETAFDASVEEIETGRSLEKVRAELSKSIDQLRNMPSLAAAADRLTADLLRVMQEQYDLIQDIERAGTMTLAHSRQLKENVERYETTMDSFSKWVDSEGAQYGIKRKAPQ
jgi:rhomboid protease GluP